MNELAVNLASERVDDGYLKVLIVAQAAVAKVPCKFFAVLDGFQVAFEVDPDPVSHWDAVFHIEKEFLHCQPSNHFNEDHERDATIGNGFPRFRALARMTAIERFNETAMLAADEPSSISSIRCAAWAAVHFRLPMRTIRFNPMDQVWFRSGRFDDGNAPSRVCARSHFLPLKRLRSDRATCLWRLRSLPGGNARA